MSAVNVVLHMGTDQPYSSSSPNANPNPTLNTLGGSRPRPRPASGRGRSRGSAAKFGGVLLKSPRAAERPASTDQTGIRHEIRNLRVLRLRLFHSLGNLNRCRGLDLPQQGIHSLIKRIPFSTRLSPPYCGFPSYQEILIALHRDTALLRPLLLGDPY